MLNLSFPQSMKKICEICGFDYYHDLNIPDKPALLDFLDQIEGSKPLVSEDSKDDKIRILSEKVLDQFINMPSKMWLDEGINIQSQRFYKVAFDPLTERIVFPVYDSIGNLISIKGRDIAGIHESKYLYLYPCPRGKILYSEWQSALDIKKANEVIIFESEKSCMKAHSLNIKNCVAISSKTITNEQAENILRMNSKIIIALDNDCDDSDINEMVKILSYPVKMNDIYVLKDNLKLYLNEKDSPADSYEFMLNYKDYLERID